LIFRSQLLYNDEISGLCRIVQPAVRSIHHCSKQQINLDPETMDRRQFMLKSGLVVGGIATSPLLVAAKTAGSRIRWTRTGQLFAAVACDDETMTPTPVVLSAICRTADKNAETGPLRVTVEHRLLDSGAGSGEDVLEATLTVRNVSDRPQDVEIEFTTSARPSPAVKSHHVYLPLCAAGLFVDNRFAALGVRNFLKDCDQSLGDRDFTAHYLEPMASYPAERETRALLLAPVVDLFDPQRPWHVALFTPSDEPMRFGRSGDLLRAGRHVTVAAGATITERCWLILHRGDAATAWRAFHRFAHHEDYAVPAWVREFKVHYYDYLSSADGEKGRRGDGYELDTQHFREFRVGMATQHGYYPALADYLHPDRKSWKAMPTDPQGPVPMSLEKMRARIKATRQAGAKAAIYLHAALLDGAASCYQRLRESVQVDAAGKPVEFGWTGPDTFGKTWRASLGSAEWRNHLLEQARWVMELLQPDAIVVDETFAGIGYDFHANRVGPTSTGAIDFYRKLRSLVRSFGGDKAFLSSDCSMSPFVLWADGECGDHAYPDILGHPLYTQEPVRYLAALGDKPWRPCAWHFQQMWDAQMKLARQVGSGVGVSNGWIEYTGLVRLPAAAKAKLLADIATLFPRGKQS
jgi:hypothetical protein